MTRGPKCFSIKWNSCVRTYPRLHIHGHTECSQHCFCLQNVGIAEPGGAWCNFPSGQLVSASVLLRVRQSTHSCPPPAGGGTETTQGGRCVQSLTLTEEPHVNLV